MPGRIRRRPAPGVRTDERPFALIMRTGPVHFSREIASTSGNIGYFKKVFDNEHGKVRIASSEGSNSGGLACKKDLWLSDFDNSQVCS